MSQSIYNPLNLNNPVPVDFDDMSDHEPTGYSNYSFLGQKHTPETKRQISEALLGRKKPPITAEHLKNMSISRIGKKHSPEHKKNISVSRIGKKHSPETKKKISKAMKGKKMHSKPLINKTVSL